MRLFSVLLLLSLASERTQAVDVDAIYARFDHGAHAKAFDKVELGCIACHSFGAAGQTAADAEKRTLRAPEGACHYCHQQQAPAEWMKRLKPPTQCETCHTAVLPPTTHGADWVARHGTEARFDSTSCSDCHKQRFCVQCHDRKDTITFDAHDRGWLSIHGMSARANPAECGTCHLQQDCSSCHSSGGGRWP